MATTTNYGWTTPDDTALVKDGAAAIRSLGSAIDTSLNTALGTKKAGLVLLNTTSFSAVASQSINNCFSATYDNYRMVVNISTNSANDGYQYFRVRSGTTDITANYYFASYTRTTGGADTSFHTGGGALGYLQMGQQDNSNNQGQSYSFDIISPFLAQFTKLNGTVSYQNDAGVISFGTVGGLNANATSYDGFTIGTQNGTFTGTVSVYGYNK